MKHLIHLSRFLAICLSVLLSIMMNAQSCLCKSYEPFATPISLVTKVLNGSYSSKDVLAYYNVSSALISDGITLSFATATKASTQPPICTVTLKKDGIISFSSKETNRVKESTGSFFIYPGFPVPIDILPTNSKKAESEFFDKRTAGGRTFIKKFIVETKTVSPDTVRKQKWVRFEIDWQKEFQLISVRDSDDRVVVQQLWQVGADWWLYSETQFRRSWRIN